MILIYYISLDGPPVTTYSLVIYSYEFSFCTDINECELSNTMCHLNAECRNSNGSYTCECKDGYSGDGYSNCSLAGAL